MRANAENISPLEVLEDIAEELRTSRENIHAMLSQSPQALAAWKTWEMGYLYDPLSCLNEMLFSHVYFFVL